MIKYAKKYLPHIRISQIVREKKCADHVCVPKETLKSCKTNPFDSGPDKISTIDVKVCSKIVFGLLQHLEQGNKMFQNL